MKRPRSNALTLRKQEIERKRQEDAAYHIPQDSDLIIADISYSMCGRAFEGKTKIDCLREAIAPFVGRCAVLAFSDRTYPAQADSIPDPVSGTNLALALATATPLKPIHVLVCSDGAPDNASAALEAARKLAEETIIDVLYIGPATDTKEIEFMKELARVGRGSFVQFDIATKSPLLLGKTVDRLLALPSPDSINL